MSAGKGDKRRPYDKKKYDEGYERIYGKKEYILASVNEPAPGSVSIPQSEFSRKLELRNENP